MVHKYRPPGRDALVKFGMKLELEADDKLSFDEIAVCAITMEADLMYEPQCRVALKKFQQVSPLAKEKSIEELMKIDWNGVYQIQVLELLDEFEFDSFVDEWGAYGWIDKKGNKHFGDGKYEYPFYADIETLRSDLEEQQKEPEPESEPFMSEEERFSEEE